LVVLIEVLVLVSTTIAMCHGALKNYDWDFYAAVLGGRVTGVEQEHAGGRM